MQESSAAEKPVSEKMQELRRRLGDLSPLLIAFSGGVDSSFLLAVAAEVRKDNVVALMTISSSTPPEDEQQAEEIAQRFQVQLLKIAHDELAIPQYAANPTNRCYFCKNSLYEICRREAERLSIQTIADGINLDDLADYRPGLSAAKEYGITHPLVDARFTKADIRHGSKLLGLPTWEKPASPCLSSRVPYGTPITAIMLRQIAQAEAYLRTLGLREFRVRHHRTSARLEVSLTDFSKFHSQSVLTSLRQKMQEYGFSETHFDLEGYRSGVFNEGLQKTEEKMSFS